MTKRQARNTIEPICPRAFRLMLALLNAPCSREECDRLAPASNSPHYIGILRKRLNLELTCERMPFITSDGTRSWYGRYHAVPADKAKMREYLANVKAANDA